MTKVTLDCEWSDCEWVSKEASVETCLKLLEIHVRANHPPQTQSQPNQPSVKPEKAKRPEIASEMSDEDWAYFVSRWTEYKRATKLQGEEVIMQLMECCCELLRRDHHRTYPKTGVGTETEVSRLAELKQLAVRQKNRMVNRVKLGTLRQDKGEPVRKFAGRVRSLASVSEYKVNCNTCQVPIPYTEPVIMDQVIAGLADLEIQKDVLSHPEAATMDLEKLLGFVEGKESGQASQGLMSGNTVGEVDRKQKCGFCDGLHVRGKQHCNAAGKKCEKCGKIGHFAKVCRSTPVRQDVKQGSVVDKEAAKAVKEQANATVDYSDGNWACRVDISPEHSAEHSLGDDLVQGVSQEDGLNHLENYKPFKSFENKYSEFYVPDSVSAYKKAGLYGESKEVLKNKLKNKGLPTLEKEALQNNIKNKKKVGQPALVQK